MIRALLLQVALAAPAFAQDGWPALFFVSGVAENDVLNIRAAPDASAETVGHFASTARAIEAIAANEDGTWALVNVGEGTGWVLLRYLERHSGTADESFPRFVRCFGTEPFWSLTQTGPESYRFSTADATGPQIAVDWTTAPSGHRGRYAFQLGPYFGTLAREPCSDGMSDRAYGLEVMLTDPDRRQAYWGCCTLAMEP